MGPNLFLPRSPSSHFAICLEYPRPLFNFPVLTQSVYDRESAQCNALLLF